MNKLTGQIFRRAKTFRSIACLTLFLMMILGSVFLWIRNSRCPLVVVQVNQTSIIEESLASIITIPNLNYLVTINNYGQCNVWDQDNESHVKFFEFPGRLKGLDVSPDGKLVLAQTVDTTILETATWSQKKLNVWGTRQRFLSDSHRIAMETREHNICVTDLNGIVQCQFDCQDNKSGVTALTTGRERLLVAVGFTDGMIKVFDIASGENILHVLDKNKGVTHLGFVSKDRRIVSANLNGCLAIWDLETKQKIDETRPENGYIALDVHPSGQYFFTLSGDKRVCAWSIHSLRHCWDVKSHPIYPISLSFSSSNDSLYFGGLPNGSIWKIHTAFREN